MRYFVKNQYLLEDQEIANPSSKYRTSISRATRSSFMSRNDGDLLENREEQHDCFEIDLRF